RFAWAAADGRQLRQHHLVGLRRLLGVLREPPYPGPIPAGGDARLLGLSVDREPIHSWLRTEDAAAEVAEPLAEIRARLEAVFGATAWRELDRGVPLTSEQDAGLRDLLAKVPRLDTSNLAGTLHPPLRKALLAELGRRDPSLAYRAASHLWARDLVQFGPASPALAQVATRWTRGDEWACFAAVEAVQAPESGWSGEALFVPAAGAHTLLLLLGDQLVAVPQDSTGLRIEPLAALGLRGAGLARVGLDHFTLPDTRTATDRERIQRAWNVLAAADLTSIAFGM